MYVYMGHLTFGQTKPYEDWFWKKNRIELVHDHVDDIDTDRKTLTLRSRQTRHYDQLVIATGSRSNRLQVPGEQLPGVQSLYSLQDLQAMESNTRDVRHAVVVGGGLIGVELAEMLHSRNIHTTILIREEGFWGNVLPQQDAAFVSRHIMSHGVSVIHSDELREIVPDNAGRVAAVRTEKGREIPCGFVGIAVGVRPNTDWLAHTPIKVNRGVVVNRYLETNIPDVYAIGDCAERTEDIPGRQPVEQVWYTARMMGETVARTLCGERTPYAPGPWFNSAKFFDIEFQTYGSVPNVAGEDDSEMYWEHPSGRKAVHLVWNRTSNRFTGINAFGIRLRHACFDRWLRENRSIDYVMEHLAEANFDPEFSPRHEPEIAARFLQSASTISER